MSERSTNLCMAVFCCPDLTLGPMTLKLDQDMGILTMYLHTENEVARSSSSKVTA